MLVVRTQHLTVQNIKYSVPINNSIECSALVIEEEGRRILKKKLLLVWVYVYNLQVRQNVGQVRIIPSTILMWFLSQYDVQGARKAQRRPWWFVFLSFVNLNRSWTMVKKN